MFEDIGTLMGEINVFGTGVYLFIVALMFAIARGITKNTHDMILISIVIGGFGSILLFSNDIIQTAVFLTTALLIIIWAWIYLNKGRQVME